MKNNIMLPSRRSLIEQYFEDIGGSSGLSSEAERELSQRIQQGDEDALKELVQANLRFVVSIAKHYLNSGIPFAELISIGNIGLIEAAKRFDGNKGFRFISYAVWWVKQAILQAMKEQSFTVRLPANQMEELRTIKKAVHELEQKLGHSPELHEIAEELNIDLDDMDTLLHQAQVPVSLDAPLKKDEPGECIIDFIPDDSERAVEEILSQEELKEGIQKALSVLTEREAQILSMYYGMGKYEAMTLEEIGVQFSLTRERIRQIKEKALQKLRNKENSNNKLREHYNNIT